MWLHSLKVAQLLRSAACLHTNQSRSYLNHLVFLISCLFPLLLKHTTTVSVAMRITVLTKIVSGLQFYIHTIYYAQVPVTRKKFAHLETFGRTGR